MTTAVEPVEAALGDPDLIDRIANALPEDIRTEYYKELRHCRSLPENDEMLRLLRAMQFLVLLIERAPARVAEERERLDKLLSSAINSISKLNAANESYYIELQRKLMALPSDIAYGIRPEAIAVKINEHLSREFERSALPQTAEELGAISTRMKTVSSEFAITADRLGSEYNGAAEEARKVIASLQLEISDASKAAEQFTKNVAQTFSTAYRWLLVMLIGGSLIIGLAMGMLLERSLLARAEASVRIQAQAAPSSPGAPAATQSAAAPQSATPKPGR